jgi:hypothetical protein
MKRLVAVCVLSAAGVGAAHAATLSVDTLPPGFFGNTQVVLPEATLTSLGTDLYFGGAYADPGSFCAISGSSCEASLEIDFTNPVSNLSFDVGGWDPGDFVELSIFGLGDLLLGTVDINANIIGLDLSGFGTITRLFFADSSTGAGVGYANFEFTFAGVGVPEPGTLALLGLGLAGIGLRRRIKSS